MYLLYLDESGNHPSSSRVVVGGLAVFERAAYWLKRDLVETVRNFLPEELHQLPLHAPRLRAKDARGMPEPWPQLEPAQRRRLLDACYKTLNASRHPVLFATVVDKNATTEGEACRVAFEDVVSRFDLMLARFHAANRTQRGLVILPESSSLRALMGDSDPVVSEGTQWGRTRNLSEVPLCVPKSRTRLLQAAGLVTNEVWGRYEKGIARHFENMLEKFDREGTRLHGLTHRTGGVDTCWCPACFSYRAASASHQEGGGRDAPGGERGGPRRSSSSAPRGAQHAPAGPRDDDDFPPEEGNVQPPSPQPRRHHEPPPAIDDPGMPYHSASAHDDDAPEADDLDDRQPESNENRATPWDDRDDTWRQP